MPGREQYSDVVVRSEPDGTLKAVADIEVSVFIAGTTDLATIYNSREGVSQKINPFLTTAGGEVAFWVEPGAYDVSFVDTELPARISEKTIGFRNYEVGAIETAITGEIRLWSGAAAPAGWQLCDGSLAGTAALIAHLDAQGRPWGGAVGSPLVPDLRGRVAVGLGTHTDVNSLGDNDGQALANRSPKHVHTVTPDAAGAQVHDPSGQRADVDTVPTSSNGPSYAVVTYIIKQ